MDKVVMLQFGKGIMNEETGETRYALASNKADVDFVQQNNVGYEGDPEEFEAQYALKEQKQQEQARTQALSDAAQPVTTYSQSSVNTNVSGEAAGTQALSAISNSSQSTTDYTENIRDKALSTSGEVSLMPWNPTYANNKSYCDSQQAQWGTAYKTLSDTLNLISSVNSSIQDVASNPNIKFAFANGDNSELQTAGTLNDAITQITQNAQISQAVMNSAGANVQNLVTTADAASGLATAQEASDAKQIATSRAQVAQQALAAASTSSSYTPEQINQLIEEAKAAATQAKQIADELAQEAQGADKTSMLANVAASAKQYAKQAEQAASVVAQAAQAQSTAYTAKDAYVTIMQVYLNQATTALSNAQGNEGYATELLTQNSATTDHVTNTVSTPTTSTSSAISDTTTVTTQSFTATPTSSEATANANATTSATTSSNKSADEQVSTQKTSTSSKKANSTFHHRLKTENNKASTENDESTSDSINDLQTKYTTVEDYLKSVIGYSSKEEALKAGKSYNELEVNYYKNIYNS